MTIQKGTERTMLHIIGYLKGKPGRYIDHDSVMANVPKRLQVFAGRAIAELATAGMVAVTPYMANGTHSGSCYRANV